MLTTANEIGGVVSSDEKRRSYAESSRSWFIPGVADHRHMIADGIFLLDGDYAASLESDEDETKEHVNVTNITTAAEVEKDNKKASKSGKVHPIASELDVNPDFEPEQTKSRMNNAARSGSTKASKKAHARVDNTIPDRLHNGSIGNSLTKRLVIEMLKLPLRILSILLMVLTWVETKLRSILDSI